MGRTRATPRLPAPRIATTIAFTTQLLALLRRIGPVYTGYEVVGVSVSRVIDRHARHGIGDADHRARVCSRGRSDSRGGQPRIDDIAGRCHRLLTNPLSTAIALMVSFSDTVIGPVYRVDEVVGVLSIGRVVKRRAV